MSPKRQQVPIVPKRASCPKCPRKKHLVQIFPNCPPQKANDDVECEFRHLSLAEYLTAIHVHTTGQPLKVFQLFQLNRIKHCPWPMLMLLSLPLNPLCHQMFLKTCKYSPPHPIILSSPLIRTPLPNIQICNSLTYLYHLFS